MILRAIRKWMGLNENAASAPDVDVGSSAMISCEEALSGIFEYLDGELDPPSSHRIQAHFDACERCYPHLASERSFKAALQRAVEGQRAPEAVRARLLAVLADTAR